MKIFDIARAWFKLVRMARRAKRGDVVYVHGLDRRTFLQLTGAAGLVMRPLLTGGTDSGPEHSDWKLEYDMDWEDEEAINLKTDIFVDGKGTKWILKNQDKVTPYEVSGDGLFFLGETRTRIYRKELK